MLTLDLARLNRADGPIRVHEVVAPDDPTLADAELSLADGLEVDLEARWLASGEILVRGTASGVVERDCRRCLEPVREPLEVPIDLLYAPEEELDEDQEASEDEQVRHFSLASGDLDLGEAVREETILAAPLYVECREDCKGLCPNCGIDLNEETCDCTLSEPDPRWDALRALQEE